MMEALQKLIKRIDDGSQWFNRSIAVSVAGVAVLAVMLVQVTDVAGRYLLNKPLTSGVEISQIILAWAVLLGFAYSLNRGAQVRVTLVSDHLSQRAQHVLKVVECLAGLAFFSILSWGAVKFFVASWRIQELMLAPTPLPYWLPKLAIAIGVVLMAFQFFVRLAVSLFGRIK